MQNIKPCPAPLLNPRTNTPPPILFYFILFLFLFLFFFFFVLFQKFVSGENKYFVLRLPGNKFYGRVRDENE